MKKRINLNTLLVTFVFLLEMMWCTAWAGDIMVGAYYYPWYGPGGHTALVSLREHLVPKHSPALGDYFSSDAPLIAVHIDYSHRANIHFWAVSWWGPGIYEDNIIRNNILTHPRAGELKYAVLYESTGRLGSFGNPDYSNLIPDFNYLAAYYFTNPNYLKIGGKPVVFIYLTRVYFRAEQGGAALAALRSAHPNLYIVADDVFGSYTDPAQASKWEAVTAYDVYGQSLQPYGSTQAALDQLDSIYTQARNTANSVNVGLVPCATPGFNDRFIRGDMHPGAPRYLEDDSQSIEGDLFGAMLRDVVVPKIDPLAENILMVTSFNEWHEDTQIEPTMGTAGTTNVDDSASGNYYTQGDYYTDYGDLYLQILCHETVSFRAADLNQDCQVNFEDFATFAEQWRQSPGSPSADIAPPGGDGVVEFLDLAVFCALWLEGVNL